MKKIAYFFLLVVFLSGCSMTGNVVQEKHENGSISVYFCPESNCSSMISDEISKNTEYVHCAFYDVNLPDVIHSLETASNSIDTGLFTDNSNPTTLPFAGTDNRNALMHNKFCVGDGIRVLTGSFNPTFGGLDDENNLVLIESKSIAQNYEDEFQEFRQGIFGKGGRVKNPVVIINGTRVENYFCPDDWCSDKVLKTLALANKSIHFMIYSFTDNSIGDLLVQKHNEGVDVSGVLDNSQNKNTDYSQYKKLLAAGINVSLYGTSKMLLHSKVFIIDSKIVITGSYNPTKSADTENDENIVIIYSPQIAEQYEKKLEEIKVLSKK